LFDSEAVFWSTLRQFVSVVYTWYCESDGALRLDAMIKKSNASIGRGRGGDSAGKKSRGERERLFTYTMFLLNIVHTEILTRKWEPDVKPKLCETKVARSFDIF